MKRILSTVSIAFLLSLSGAVIVSGQEVKQKDTVYITKRDTVFVVIQDKTKKQRSVISQPEYYQVRKPELFKPYNTSGKHMIMAVKTNALAIPCFNYGVEVPIGKKWSVGTDIYFPWFARGGNMQNCNQMLAFDIEGRYWFAPKPLNAQSRLLGHSAGAYFATGIYDYERNGSGHQGHFFNFGVDYKWAMPIFYGRAHLEFEIGLGFIWSKAQPYDCYGQDVLYRRINTYRIVNWVGPTRAQVSLVVPIYVYNEPMPKAPKQPKVKAPKQPKQPKAKAEKPAKQAKEAKQPKAKAAKQAKPAKQAKAPKQTKAKVEKAPKEKKVKAAKPAKQPKAKVTKQKVQKTKKTNKK